MSQQEATTTASAGSSPKKRQGPTYPLVVLEGGDTRVKRVLVDGDWIKIEGEYEFVSMAIKPGARPYIFLAYHCSEDQLFEKDTRRLIMVSRIAAYDTEPKER